MVSPHITIRLITQLDSGRIVVRVHDDEGDGAVVFTGLHAILDRRARAAQITLELRDFFHDGCVYQVYGAVLDNDGSSIREYWSPNYNHTGQAYTFTVPPSGRTFPDIVIGAYPRSRDVPVPTPMRIAGKPAATDQDDSDPRKQP